MPAVIDLGNDERKQRMIQMLLQWMQQKDQRGLIEAQGRYTDANTEYAKANTRDTDAQAEVRRQQAERERIQRQAAIGGGDPGTGRPFDMAIDGRVGAEPYRPAQGGGVQLDPHMQNMVRYAYLTDKNMPESAIQASGLANTTGANRRGYELQTGEVMNAHQQTTTAETNRNNIAQLTEEQRKNTAEDAYRKGRLAQSGPLSQARTRQAQTGADLNIQRGERERALASESVARITPGSGYEQIQLKLREASNRGSGKPQTDPQKLKQLAQIQAQASRASALVRQLIMKSTSKSENVDQERLEAELAAAKEAEAALVQQAEAILKSGITTGNDADAKLNQLIIDAIKKKQGSQ